MDVIDFKLFWKQLQKHGKIMFIYDYFILDYTSFIKKYFPYASFMTVHTKIYNFLEYGNFIILDLIIRVSSTKVFSCEYCEIFESIYFEEHLQALLLPLVIQRAILLQKECSYRNYGNYEVT